MGCGCGIRLDNPQFSLPSYEWDWSSFAAGIIGGAMIFILGVYGVGQYWSKKGEQKTGV